jgi:hypothetical protein
MPGIQLSAIEDENFLLGDGVWDRVDEEADETTEVRTTVPSPYRVPYSHWQGLSGLLLGLWQGYLGNEGATRDRTYSTSVLVFWPRSLHLSNMMQWNVPDYGLAALASKLNDGGTVAKKDLPPGVKTAKAWVQAVLDKIRGMQAPRGKDLSGALTVLATVQQPDKEQLAKLLELIRPVLDAGPELEKAVRLAGERLGWEAALPLIRAAMEKAAAASTEPPLQPRYRMLSSAYGFDAYASSASVYTAFRKLRALEGLVKACPPLAPLRAEIYPRLVDAVVDDKTLDNNQVLEALQILVELAKAEELLRLLRRLDVVGLPEEQVGPLVEVLKALGGRFGYDALREPLLIAFGLCKSHRLMTRANGVLAACPPLENLRPALKDMAVDAMVKHAAQLQGQQLVDAVNAVAR